MPKPSKKELVKLCKDHNVQLLLNKFVSDELETLSPVFDLGKGFRYPIVDEIVGESNTDNFLSSLYEGGVLDRKLYDKMIYCPSCSSANISTHYTCPNCKSFDIKKSALVEHIKCGYIDTEDHFKSNGKLVCPRCNKELVNPDLDYNKAGVWCTCNQCGRSFDIPVPTHFCRDCEETFSFDEAPYKDVYTYTLTQETTQEANGGWIIVDPIAEFLENHGFKVESPGYLNGKSGTRHMFDLTAVSVDGNAITAIDVAISNGDVVSEQSVISMFAKIFDATPNKACLIAVPKMTENGKKLAALYNIHLIEARDQNAAIQAVKTCAATH